MKRVGCNPWQDAKRKTEYLQARYASVSPCRFYDEILGHIEDEPNFQLCAMHAQAKKGQRMRRYDDVMDMLLDAGARRDAYVYPAAYYHSYALEALMQSTSCLYIDLDHVAAKQLRRLCDADFFGHRPTYLVNSGNGVHLVYVLQEPVQTYDWAKKLLKRIHHGLLKVFRRHRFDADLTTGISHAYRIVGSLTKLGQVCRAYCVGTHMTIAALAQSVGVTWTRPQKAVHPVTKAGRRAATPHAKRGFYAYLVEKIAERTQEGHRYTALFALTYVGYKCGMALEAISEDVMHLAAVLGLPQREAKHALEVCDPEKARTVRAATLENWLGWSFDRKTKRNGRTREEHLAKIAADRTEASRRRVWACLREAPLATISELARKLSITRRTAAKYFHEWMDRLLDRVPAQMAASEPVASARTAKAAKTSDAGIAAPASFIAYIPAPWGELGSVCAGRTEDNRADALRSSLDSITSTFLLLCRWLYAKLYPETSTSTSHYGKDEEAWQT